MLCKYLFRGGFVQNLKEKKIETKIGTKKEILYIWNIYFKEFNH